MHHVAVIPEAVPVPLLHLLVIERERRVELVFNAALGRRGTVGQAPDAEDAGRVDMLRRGDDQRRLLGQLRLMRRVFFAMARRRSG